MIRYVLSAVLAVLVLSACNKRPGAVDSTPAVSAPATNQQIFQVKGVVMELKPDGKTVRIRHEEITNYMAAMTMPFEVKDTNELAGLAAGDAVMFRMIVTDTDGWIDQVKKLDLPRTNILPTTGPVRVVREVEPLKEGDVLPEYRFVNQSGERIRTTQFKGGVLAINFLFTRCPFPTFCPLMASRFAEAQNKLLAATNAPANWHLLTISFDPEFDKPEVLKAYAAQHGCKPERWTFATGELLDITTIGEQFGLSFWRDETGSITHNLRTAVVDPAGRVRKILIGNEWTSDQLVEAVVEAAKE
jgi:protein SCO1/2